MTSGNLPDDVTHDDIDKHYGPPPEHDRIVYGVARVALSVKAFETSSEEDKKKLLRDAFKDDDIDDLLDVEIVEEEPYN